MSSSLVICGSCRCHARLDERWCPHCEADLSAVGALLAPRPRRIEIRRMLFAVAAMGLGASSCGGQTVDSSVVGSCARIADTSQTLSCLNQCTCGFAGRCDGQGRCISCNCANPHDQCNPDGSCSTRPCYGAPPPLV